MRKILIPISVMVSCGMNAQLFSFDPGVNHNAELSLENTTVLFTYITNLTADSISMEWRKIEDTLPEAGLPGEGWFTEMCDVSNCYTYLPNNDVMPIPIAPGESGFVKLILNPQGQEGSGLVHYWVYPEGQMELHEDFYFFVWTPGVSGVDDNFTETISVFPNPTSDMLNIYTTETGCCKIFDAAGKEAGSAIINSPGRCIISVGHLPDGLYIVRMNDEVIKLAISK